MNELLRNFTPVVIAVIGVLVSFLHIHHVRQQQRIIRAAQGIPESPTFWQRHGNDIRHAASLHLWLLAAGSMLVGRLLHVAGMPIVALWAAALLGVYSANWYWRMQQRRAQQRWYHEYFEPPAQKRKNDQEQAELPADIQTEANRLIERMAALAEVEITPWMVHWQDSPIQGIAADTKHNPTLIQDLEQEREDYMQEQARLLNELGETLVERRHSYRKRVHRRIADAARFTTRTM